MSISLDYWEEECSKVVIKQKNQTSTICNLLQDAIVIVHSVSHAWLFVNHELQHTRLPCPSLSPGICSNSYPLSWWYCLTILSSATPFSFCHQSFPIPGSFPMSQLFNQVAKALELQLQHQSFLWKMLVGFENMMWCLQRDLVQEFYLPCSLRWSNTIHVPSEVRETFG